MKIVFIGPVNITYCKREIGFLRKYHEVKELDSIVGLGWMAAVNLALLTLKSIWAILRADAVYCWFADYHTFVPAFMCHLLGKKSVIVVAGFDVGYIPEINYGARTRPVRWFCVRQSLKYASHLFAVSSFTVTQIESAVPKRKGKTFVVYLCSDESQYPSDVGTERTLSTLTISQADNYTEYIRKGSDRFIRIAQATPDVTFYLVGLRGQALELSRRDAEGVSNLVLMPGPVNFETGIVPLFMSCASYCQLSLEEAGATAVTEAILAGMYPIVTAGSGMTELVGEFGAVITEDQQVQNAVREAYTVGPDYRRRVRVWGDRYTVQTRESQVLNLVSL
jgi:glycosyltransferase involved in cell wall biosynthesis